MMWLLSRLHRLAWHQGQYHKDYVLFHYRIISHLIPHNFRTAHKTIHTLPVITQIKCKHNTATQIVTMAHTSRIAFCASPRHICFLSTPLRKSNLLYHCKILATSSTLHIYLVLNDNSSNKGNVYVHINKIKTKKVQLRNNRQKLSMTIRVNVIKPNKVRVWILKPTTILYNSKPRMRRKSRIANSKHTRSFAF